MASLEKLEQKRAQIDAQIKDAKRALAKEQRKAEAHAKIVIGGMVLSRFENDWRSVDFEKLAAYFEQYGGVLAQSTCEELPLAEAKKRLRNWEVFHNPWNSYGNPANEAEASATEMHGEAVKEGNQGQMDSSDYPSALPEEFREFSTGE